MTTTTTISGSPIQGQTLTATFNNDVSSNTLTGYKWFRNGNAITNATASTYTLTQEDVSEAINVQATYSYTYQVPVYGSVWVTSGYYTSSGWFGSTWVDTSHYETQQTGVTTQFATASVTSDNTTAVLNVNDLPMGSVSISGITTEGQVLTASNTLADLDGLGAIEYQWWSDGNLISGATASAYTLTASDVGKVVRVTASYVDSQGTTESVTSNASELIVGLQVVPTGNVTISGTTQQNQTLWATNNLVDANGLGSISYQWLRDGAVISNSDSYSLIQNDVGKNISVTASYVDGLGKLETVNSYATLVTNVNDAPTGNVTISGTVAQGQTLTASNNLTDLDGLGTISYQWLRDGATISGTSSSNYTLTSSDAGRAISVKASYTDGFGTLENITSNSTELVLAGQTVPTGSIAISGTAQQDQTLTATNNLADANGMGVIAYQWLINNSVVSNSDSYALTQNDVGKSISLKASYTDGLGKVESVSSSSVTVSNLNDLPTGNVTISGTAVQGQTLNASNNLTDLDGLGAIKYQWLRDGLVISNATYSTYTLTASDVGKAISVKASYTDLLKTVESVTSNSTELVLAGQTAPTGKVTVDGTAQQNQTLTANTSAISDVNGLGTFSYQWLINNSIVSNSDSYALTQNEVGKSISLKASYTDGLGKFESVTSSSVTVSNVNDLPTGNVTILGAAAQGQTLNASNNLTDLDGLGAIKYQWLRDGSVISNATYSTYTLTASDVGKAISVKASYTDLSKTLESVTSNPTAAVTAGQTAPIGKVTIDGMTQQNQTLTANTSAISDVNGLGTFSYQWLSNGSVVSNSDSYALTQNDVGKSISLKASYTDSLGKLESMTSSSVTVSNVNDLPTGNVTILGTAAQGQTLNASNNLTDLDGLGAIKYQWLRDGSAISGTSSSNYTLTASDVGKAISVKASYTDLFKTFESVTSNPTAAVTAGQTAPIGKVTINGTTQQNQTLTANTSAISDVNGLGTFSYQWISNGSVVSNSDSYALTQNEVGKSISLKASYTDGLGKLESMSSNAVNVANVNDAPTGDVIITGTPTQKQTLKVTNTLADLDGLGAVSYQWQADGTPVGTGNSYILTQVEVGKTITVLASYTDGQGTAEAVMSDATEQIADINDQLTGSVNVTGKLIKGQVLTATDTLKDADGLGVLSYQWLSNGKVIDNATDKTFLLGRSEISKKISVKVSYTDGFDNLESTTSKETLAVKNDGAINGLTKVGDANKNKLIGSAKNDDLSGLAGADTLIGNAGNDILDGGTGNDSLDGGNGNDELLGGEGDDMLLGGSGNDLLDAGLGNDKLVGDLGNDTLKGGLGVDTMDGGDGNDYYFVDNIKDNAIESNKNSTLGGVDTVESTSDYVLPDNIENFVLKDSQGKGHSGTGNKANNVITGSIGDDVLKGMAGNDKLNGSDGDDTLDGGLGMDTLSGGNGSDVYMINNLEDKIIETANGSDQDQIISTVTYDLETAPNVEMLTLSGVKAITGTGNDLNNLLQEQDGGKVANVFDGGVGDDTINGAGGNDTLTGGEGNDVMDGGDGKDVAIFTGAFINYQITRNPDAEGVDQIFVEYAGNKEDGEIDEGMDSLTNIETLQFADGETINTRDVTDSSAMLILTGEIG